MNSPMSNELINTIISADENLRNRSINDLLKNKNKDQILQSAEVLNSFRMSSNNLYYKVRASLFLCVIYRTYLPYLKDIPQHGKIPFEGVKAACNRDFEKSINVYLSAIENDGSLNSAVCSALADSFYKLSFKYLIEQVKLSISHCKENHHLFDIKGLDNYSFSVPEEMTIPDDKTGLYPVGMDASPVRLDPSHSGWSDIFFLGMDFPEGARVVNMSVDLTIHESGRQVMPPCECYCRYIEEPVIHLVSIDLQSSKKIDSVSELFNFGNDYLSLLKAGVIASGIVPPAFEYMDIDLKLLLQRLIGKSGGMEIVTRVNNIPKGSRLAVSTTLLATIITRLMRFSGQIGQQTGSLSDSDRRIVASRAILGEWLGGSGGGWQDSGGLWPGIKVITGRPAEQGNPEYGISRGCLLPDHNIFERSEISRKTERKITDSLVLVHGGISQDVGPILEMVTEKYLLKYEEEWKARLRGIELFDRIVEALRKGDMKELGRLTTLDWEESIQKVIPWVNNAFTEELIQHARNDFGDRYWGFLMLGGMSGGGMAFIIDPDVKEVFKNRIGLIMKQLKDKYRHSLPFIIDPVVYDFELNHEGIVAKILKGRDAVIPSPEKSTPITDNWGNRISEEEIKKKYGFDPESHSHLKELLKNGEIGLKKNRLSEKDRIEDVSYDDIFHYEREYNTEFEKVSFSKENNFNSALDNYYRTGVDHIRNGEVAVVTFAGGVGSRWSHGAAVVKSINPFVKIKDKFRTFLEIHIAKSRKTNSIYGGRIPHIFTTSYLTHDAIESYLKEFRFFDYGDDLLLSPGKSIARRVFPAERDLRHYWEEQMEQKKDDNIQKVQDSARGALIQWAKSMGECGDYDKNIPLLRFSPPGHWYEVPNMLKNGILSVILKSYPEVKYLLCHNIDTMGASIDPVILGMHINRKNCITFEVTPRRVEDAGGGLARVNDHIRLVEGMALPRDEDEYRLSYYNTLTNWVSLDSLLDYMGLDRITIENSDKDPGARQRIIDAIHRIEKKIPTYVTIKNVKYVWGSGQEDVYPVSQFEKLWGDMTSLENLRAGYVSVSRFRGQQLKEPALLDIWVNDGALDYVKNRCLF